MWERLKSMLILFMCISISLLMATIIINKNSIKNYKYFVIENDTLKLEEYNALTKEFTVKTKEGVIVKLKVEE